MRYQQPAPLFVNGEAVGKQTKLLFEESSCAVRIFRRKAIAVAIDGASTGIPKFCNVLRRVAENCITPKEGVNSRGDGGIIAVFGLYPAEKDVAIDEVRRLRHLSDPHRSFRAKNSR